MFRYLSAGILSVAIHALIFAPLFDQPVMAQPMSQQSQSVSISFSTPKPTPKKVETTPVQTETPPVPVKEAAPTVAKPKPVVKKTVKKRIVKEKSVTKKEKKQVPKAIQKVKKQAAPVKKPKKKIQQSNKPTATAAAKKETKQIEQPTAAPKAKQTVNAKQVVKTDNGLQGKPQLIQKSRFLSKPKPPRYPRLAKRKGIEGTVTYEVWLDEKGKQVKLLLKDSSGARVLDLAALKAIKKWRFSPHSVNGKTVAHRIYVPISFQLD